MNTISKFNLRGLRDIDKLFNARSPFARLFTLMPLQSGASEALREEYSSTVRVGQAENRITKESLTVYICHCHQCQRRTGSAFSMALVVPADGLQIDRGEVARSERPMSDGQKNISVACRDCRSRLYTQHSQRNVAATINSRAGTLDDTSRIRPVAQMWTSSAQLWAVQQGILSYSEQQTDYAPWLDAWKSSE